MTGRLDEVVRAWKCWFVIPVLGFFLTACQDTAPADPARYFILEDSTLQLNARKSWQLFQEGKFKQQTTHSFNPGFTTSFYWMVVHRSSEGNKNIQLEIGTPQINEIEFYWMDENTPVQKYFTGDHQVFSSRPVPSLNFVFPLSETHAWYLLKIDKKNESLQLTFHTHESAVFQHETVWSSMVVGILTGAIVLMLVFGLFLYLINREYVYLFYILYIAAGWLYVFSNLGYAYQYLWPDHPWFGGRVRPLSMLLTVAFSLHFLEHYTGKAGFRWLHIALRLLVYTAYGLAMLVIMPSFELKMGASGYYFQALLPGLASLYLIIILITLTQKLVNKNKMAMFYLASLFPIIFFSTLQIFYYSGGMDFSGSYLRHYGQATGYVMEAIILTFGLAYRFNTYRLEKESLLINLNRQQARYAKTIIATQENERRQLADQLHDVAGSLLSAAKLNLSSVREKNFITNEEARIKLANAEEAVTDISEMLRNLSHAISPVMLDKVGFRQSVEKIAGIFNSSGKIAVELEMLGFETGHPELHEKYSILYGILYELMNNIAKHAQASHALIQLIEHEDTVVMMVEDNGIGLVVSTALQQETHGLAAIQSKIHYLNGTFALDAADPHGLIITIEIPKETHDKNYSG